MLKFQFLPVYVKNNEFNKGDLRISIIEVPCQDPNEEEYRFRIKTRHKEEEIIIHRDIAIEHHQPRAIHPHGYEHLQFKLYSEGFGKIRIDLDIKDENEYKSCILGFLSILKDLIAYFDEYHKDIVKEILNIEMFNELDNDRNFLIKKISASLNESRIEIDNDKGIKVVNKDSLEDLKKNEALLPFFEDVV